MIIKSFEIRDRATFIAAIAIKMTTESVDVRKEGAFDEWHDKNYLIRRCGYSNESPAVILLRMDGRAGPNDKAPSDPYDWGDRTMQVAHAYITERFDRLENGAVVDVEYILGETKEPKRSEREDVRG